MSPFKAGALPGPLPTPVDNSAPRQTLARRDTPNPIPHLILERFSKPPSHQAGATGSTTCEVVEIADPRIQ